MGVHSRTRTAALLPTGARAVATTGLAVLGLVGGAGAAFAGDAPTAGDHSGSSSGDSGTVSEKPDGSECSVGGIAAGGTGTGSPDGVITNGECTDEQNEQAAKDAEAVRNGTAEPDPDYDVDENLEKSRAEQDSGSSGEDDAQSSNSDGDDRPGESIVSGVL